MDIGERAAIAPKLWAVRSFFFMAGLGMSTWAIIAPFTKIRFGLDDGTLGLILFVGGIGGVLAMPFCGLVMARTGSRTMVVWSSALLAAMLPALAMAPSVVAFTVLLFIYGIVFGAVDVSMNAQASLVESRSGGRQMSLFHGFFSIGGLAVALATSLLLQAGASNVLCAWITGAAALLLLPQARHLLPASLDPTAEGRRFAPPNRATIVLGLGCFSCFLTEGAATDWSTIFLRFSRGMPLAGAALGYAAFATMMAGSRLLGDRLVMRLGPAQVMRLGCLLAAAGLLLAITVPSGWVGIFGFALVGLGTGNIAPLVFSAAGRVPGMAPSLSVPAVVGLGYVGFLIGPVAIGLIARHFSLSVAYAMDAALLGATFFAAEAVAV